MLTDMPGRPLRFVVTAGQVGDVTQAQALPAGQEGAAVMADQAYDSNALRAPVAQMGAEAVIPCNRTRMIPELTSCVIVSRAASTASSTSDALLPDMIDAPSISLAVFTSPQP